jgi:hypothetical protein
MRKKSARARGGGAAKPRKAQSPSIPSPPANGRPWTSREAADYLQITLRTLHTYRLRGLPCFRLNARTFKYYQRDLDFWVMQQAAA